MFQTKHLSIGLLVLIGFELCVIGVMPHLIFRHEPAAYALASTYAPLISYPVGKVPIGVVAADLTGHGFQDLAVANNLDNTVSILKNNGHGIFTIHLPRIHTGDNGNPVGIVVGDFMGHGYKDLAVSNVGNSTVSILANDGSGNFTLGPIIGVGSLPYGIVAGDFTGNGRQDLAITNQGDNSVTILQNNGGGNFTTQATFAVGQLPQEIVAGDFMGNGRQDLAVALAKDNAIRIVKNNGDGTFTPQGEVLAGVEPHGIVAGHLTGSGRLDLAVTNYSTSGTVSILKNNGGGIFTLLTPAVPVGNHPQAITVGDFTGAGHADLAVDNLFDNTMSLLVNDGSGNFTPQSPMLIGANPLGITAGNFTGTAPQELAITNQGNGSSLAGYVTLLLNAIPPTPTPTPVTPTPTPTPVTPTPTPVTPTPTPTPVTPTPTPTPPTPTPVPTITPTPPFGTPDIAVAINSRTSPHVAIASRANYDVTVSNVIGEETIPDASVIAVKEILPVGLRDIKASGQSWQIDQSASQGVTTIEAYFTDHIPLPAGAQLPPLYTTGKWTADAIPSYTTTAYAEIAGDINPTNNLATYTLGVKGKSPEQSVPLQNNQHQHGQRQNNNNQQDNRGATHFYGSSGGRGGYGGYPLLPMTGGRP